MKADTKKHIAQAKRNLKFLKSTQEAFPEEYFEWKITIVFYCTLHLAKAYLYECFSVKTENHEDIKSQLYKTNVKKHVGKYYRSLEVLCHNCRYNGFINEDQWNKLNKLEFETAIKRANEINKYFKKKNVGVDFDLLSLIR